MKKPLLFSVILFIILSYSYNNKSHAQKTKEQLPEVVKSAFIAKYPNEKPDDWEVDDHGYYEFHFKKDDIKHRADFLKNGKWIETEISIDEDELPKAVRKVIKKKYDNEEITEVEKVMHHSHGTFYDVEFKQKGKNKDVMFRPDGSIIN